MKTMLLNLLMILSLEVYAQNGYKVGDLAEDFQLKNVDGQMVSLQSKTDAKGFILVFTCNTCPISQAYQDRVEELHRSFAKSGYPVIAINTNDPVASPGDSFSNMQIRAKQKGFSYAYLEDPDQVYTKKYGAAKTPHVFILQKNNKGLEVIYTGAIDNDTEQVDPNRTDYVKLAINALQLGKKPEISSTKAVGCSIKWKKVSN